MAEKVRAVRGLGRDAEPAASGVPREEPLTAIGRRRVEIPDPRGLGELQDVPDLELVRPAVAGDAVVASELGGAERENGHDKIGRASCRERV